jgi:hypothetical protein
MCGCIAGESNRPMAHAFNGRRFWGKSVNSEPKQGLDAKQRTSAQINAELEKIGRMTLGEAWGHFQEHELRVNRSPTTIDGYLDYFQSQILPTWKVTALDDVKAVAAETWVRGLDDLAPGSKAKIRNHM